MEQLRIIQKDNKIKSCAFTGHRELLPTFDAAGLWEAIEDVIQRGAEIFYNGMAVGFDMLAAEAVLFLKKKYPQIKLVVCIPFYNQEKYYNDTDKARYARILKEADEQVILSESFSKDAPLKRDRYMADRADVLIAYCKRKNGGTAYTVNYFGKIKPLNEIIRIN